MIEAIELAKLAQSAGLVVLKMEPMHCHNAMEYRISLWSSDGRCWAESTHETKENVENIIQLWKEKAK